MDFTQKEIEALIRGGFNLTPPKRTFQGRINVGLLLYTLDFGDGGEGAVEIRNGSTYMMLGMKSAKQLGTKLLELTDK